MLKGVSAIIFNNNQEILVLKRIEEVEFSPNSWDFPGGKANETETLTEALLREVKEETNLDILPDKEYSFTYDYPNGKITIYTFKAKLLGGDIKLDKKHTDFKWISRENWKDLNYSLSTKAFLTEYFK